MKSIVNRAVYIPFEYNRSSNRDLIRGKKIQIALKTGYHRSASERHLNSVSLAGQWWPNIECWLGSFVVFQGIRTSIAKKPYVFVIFRRGVLTSCPPSGSTRDPVWTYVIVSKRENRSWHTVSPEVCQSWSYRSQAQWIVSELIYPHHYVSKPKITKKSHDQIRMANHCNRNVSHDSGNAALASDYVQMKRWKYFIKIPAKYIRSFLKTIWGLCALVHIL